MAGECSLHSSGSGIGTNVVLFWTR